MKMHGTSCGKFQVVTEEMVPKHFKFHGPGKLIMTVLVGADRHPQPRCAIPVKGSASQASDKLLDHSESQHRKIVVPSSHMLSCPFFASSLVR
jgi:hypothetical protein